MDAKILRVLRVIAVLLAAILTLIAYKTLGKEIGALVLGIIVVSLPIALFPISQKK